MAYIMNCHKLIGHEYSLHLNEMAVPNSRQWIMDYIIIISSAVEVLLPNSSWMSHGGITITSDVYEAPLPVYRRLIMAV